MRAVSVEMMAISGASRVDPQFHGTTSLELLDLPLNVVIPL